VLTDAAAGKIDVLHLIGVDLARDCDDPELAAKALKKVGTVVAQDLALNDTVAEHADVVLPATGTQERAGSMTNWEGRTQRFSQAVDGYAAGARRLGDRAAAGRAARPRPRLQRPRGAAPRDRPRRRRSRSPTPGPRSRQPPTPRRRTTTRRLALVTYPLLIDGGTMLADAVTSRPPARSPGSAQRPRRRARSASPTAPWSRSPGPASAACGCPPGSATTWCPARCSCPATSDETPLGGATAG
jgi:NADH-quinone oxidoreductase subunit G